MEATIQHGWCVIPQCTSQFAPRKLALDRLEADLKFVQTAAGSFNWYLGVSLKIRGTLFRGFL